MAYDGSALTDTTPTNIGNLNADWNTLNSRQYPNDEELGIVTSTNIQIKINGVRVGLIQSFRRDESREVQKIQEIGSEGLVQLVPQNYQGGNLNVNSMAVYGRLFFRAIKIVDFGAPQTYIANYNPVGMLVQNRIPFSVEVLTRGRKAGGTQWYTSQTRETFHGCFLTNYTKDVQVSDITVAETVQIAYTRVEVKQETTSREGLSVGTFLKNPYEAELYKNGIGGIYDSLSVRLTPQKDSA